MTEGSWANLDSYKEPVPLEPAPPEVIAYGWVLMAKYGIQAELHDEFISEMHVMNYKWESEG